MLPARCVLSMTLPLRAELGWEVSGMQRSAVADIQRCSCAQNLDGKSLKCNTARYGGGSSGRGRGGYGFGRGDFRGGFRGGFRGR